VNSALEAILLDFSLTMTKTLTKTRRISALVANYAVLCENPDENSELW